MELDFLAIAMLFALRILQQNLPLHCGELAPNILVNLVPGVNLVPRVSFLCLQWRQGRETLGKINILCSRNQTHPEMHITRSKMTLISITKHIVTFFFYFNNTLVCEYRQRTSQSVPIIWSLSKDNPLHLPSLKIMLALTLI